MAYKLLFFEKKSWIYEETRTELLHVEFGGYDNHTLAGTALAQCLGQIGNKSGKIDWENFKAAFIAIQNLIKGEIYKWSINSSFFYFKYKIISMVLARDIQGILYILGFLLSQPRNITKKHK